jgi:RNA-directed DNA polymerase
MSQLQALRAAVSIHQVAPLLHFQAKTLAYILYKKPLPTRYSSFNMAKRDGSVRTINAPAPDLKLLQNNLSDLLQNCVEEINKGKNLKDQLAHGFKRDRSIITNAVKHRKRRYVFNIDLNDFFGTINFGRVRGFFIKDASFMLNANVATILAQIACHESILPQGSPCSPVISNLIGNVLDIHLCKLASTNGCTYSRYADDITFSTGKPDFPMGIARRVAGQAHTWEIGSALQNIVTHTGFSINPKKTRMQYRGSRQAVTGLVVNRKVNVRTEYRRKTRSLAHELFKTGTFHHVRTIRDANGVVSPTTVEGTLEQLHGILGFIDRVDCHNFEREFKVDPHEAKAALRSKEKLYRRFLMFKDFYAAKQPVMVCEGKTDNVYLLHAIRSLAAFYPKLATVDAAKKITLNVRILKTVNTSTGRVLQLDGGASFLEAFIKQYLVEIGKFKAPGMQCAVVVLVDNDKGGDDIYNAIRTFTKKKAPKSDPYVHVAGNLYAVLTPLKAGASKSTIEDCFADEIKKLNLGGKTFSANSKIDTAAHFGKHKLSEYIRENATKVDFTGFAGLLDRINDAIESHQAKVAGAPAGNGVGLQP